MYEEKTIIILQFIAAIFMSFDYFLSAKLKEYADNVVKNYLLGVQQEVDKDLKLQSKVFVNLMPYVFTTLFGLGIYFALLQVSKSAISFGWPEWVVPLIMLGSLFFAYGGFQSFIKVFFEGVVPYALPVIFRAFTTSFIYCPKGPLAAIGMFFLLLSFWFSYSNAAA